MVAIVNPKTTFNELDSEDEISFVPMESINANTGSITETYSKKISETKGFTKFQEHDLIWAKITPCMQNGKSAIARNLKQGYGCGSTEFHVIRPRSKDTVLVDYLHILLRDERVLETAQNFFGGSAGQQRVSSDFLRNLKIPLPPLEMQAQIVSLFQNAYQAKRDKEAEAKQLLDSIDSYILAKLGIELPAPKERKKVFYTSRKALSGGRFDPYYHQEEFEELEKSLARGKYETARINQLCYDVRGVTYSNADETREGIKILRANNINVQRNELDLSDIRYIRHDFEISENQRLRKNDILMCAASGSKEHSGKVAYIYKNLDCYFGGFMMVLRSQGSFPKYLFEMLASSIFRKYLMKILGGTNINNLNFSMFKSFEIPLPPMSVQEEIAAHISSLRAEAKRLEREAEAEIEAAKREVERMIVGGGE